VTYFCFIESDILGVPHMEPLSAETLDDAQVEAAQLLSTHTSGIAAHVFDGETRVHTVRAEAMR